MLTLEQDRQAGYRPGVGLLLIHNQRVLLARKASQLSCIHCDETGNWSVVEPAKWEFGWDIPQGGIEMGETIEDAIRREMREELSEDWELEHAQMIRREASDFPVNKDGRSYRGKTYYYHAIEVACVPDYYWDWVYGPRGDEPASPLPVNEFPGGVLFMSVGEAIRAIETTRGGGKAKMLVSVLEEVWVRGLIN